jgi:hypothetical protein
MKRVLLQALLAGSLLGPLSGHAAVEVTAFGIIGSAPSNHVFTVVGTQQIPGTQAGPGAGAVWPVTINGPLLITLPVSVVLNLPGRPEVTLHRVRSEPRGAGFLWTGRGGDCSALFSAIPARFRAVISCLDAPYGVETTTSGVELTRYDAFDVPTGTVPSDAVSYDGNGTGTLDVPDGEIQGTNDQQIDVLVLYTSAVRQAVEAADGNVQQVMHDEVDTTQLAMDNSSSLDTPMPDLHFAHAVEVSRDETHEFTDDLDYLRLDQEPVGLRNIWAADIVMLVRETSLHSYVCGQANEPHNVGSPDPGPDFAPLALGVTVRNCSFAPYGFEHELGHIFGANHNPENTPSPTPIEPWAYAHWKNHGPDDSARTIVSDIVHDPPGPDCHGSCPQVLNYSNADVIVSWFRTGVTDQQENARVIAEFAHVTAQYRAGIDRIFADGFE